MGVHLVPEKTRASQQVWGMDQSRYGGRGRRPIPATRGVVALHDVGQEAQAREGAQRSREGERATVAAVQQPPAAPILPTGAVQSEGAGARSDRRILPHSASNRC